MAVPAIHFLYAGTRLNSSHDDLPIALISSVLLAITSAESSGVSSRFLLISDFSPTQDRGHDHAITEKTEHSQGRLQIPHMTFDDGSDSVTDVPVGSGRMSLATA